MFLPCTPLMTTRVRLRLAGEWLDYEYAHDLNYYYGWDAGVEPLLT
jgi:hypothetical protein